MNSGRIFNRYYGLSCIPPKFKHLGSIPQYLRMWPLFGDRVFKEVKWGKVKVRSWGWALILYDWCLYKKRKDEHSDTHRGKTMWRDIRERMAIYKCTKAWNRSFPPSPSEGINPADTLTLDFQTPELWDNTFLLVKPSRCGTLLPQP